MLEGLVEHFPGKGQITLVGVAYPAVEEYIIGLRRFKLFQQIGKLIVDLCNSGEIR